jgi:replicative DNA helicase
VLGAILLDPSLMQTITTRLRPSDFYIQRHRVIYRALLVLQAQEVEIDLRTLQAQLEGQQQLGAVGGLAYLASLDLDLPDIGRIDAHVAIIEERSRRRRLRNPLLAAAHS